MNPVQTITIDTKQPGVNYTRMETGKYSSLTLKTPYVCATANDNGAAPGNPFTISSLPAREIVQAGRWARGTLLAHNRQAECLKVNSIFNPSMTALVRVDVEGTTDANGQWIVDEVEHDLINLTSETKMLRVITTIQ